ncbi:Hint domain-containing protein [Rhodobacteraceae bacterium G21628-S1]|nr:Hint domain-containing protein [Rhodobacteraceae bacterium G21628-S1]
MIDVTDDTISLYALPAYPAEQFCVDIGANSGDAVGLLDELVMDDIYELSSPARLQRLAFTVSAEGAISLHSDSEMGQPEAALYLDCAITLMPDLGSAIEALIAVEVDKAGVITAVYLIPQAPLSVGTGYRLVRADRACVWERLAQLSCVAFSRGTHITMGTGEQRTIETLQPGDRVLTRNSGARTITWVGQTTVRAVGEMAPILIREGALNNARDLLVSPDHRLMIYQRSDVLGTGRHELMIRARDLVNGESVVVQDGGFIDYYQILFNHHHIIYAEGIAAESMLVDAVTRPALPEDIQRKVATPRRHGTRGDHGLEIRRPLLQRPDAVELLKRASLR